MTTIEQIHAAASSLLSKKLKSSTKLKNELHRNLKIVNNQTNGEIYDLWNELEQIYDKHKQNNNISNTNTNKKARGTKRKYESTNTNKHENNDTQPPKKRNKTSLSGTRTSASSSISSSNKTIKHRKLTMRTTSNDIIQNGHNNNKNEQNHSHNDEDDNYLYQMLKNVEKAKELTDKNMNILQKCIDSVDVFQDLLEGDILEFGDQIRKTFQEFPFKTIIPSYHEKTLKEELRLNRMLSKYGDLSQTELDIYKLQNKYVSQYKLKRNDESPRNEQKLISSHDRNHNRSVDEEEEKGQEEEIVNIRNNNLMDSDHEDNKWCLCERASNGKMIRCDNRLCSIQWFHWKCVRIMKIPKDKWYCKSCRKYPTKSNLLHPKFQVK